MHAEVFASHGCYPMHAEVFASHGCYPMHAEEVFASHGCYPMHTEEVFASLGCYPSSAASIKSVASMKEGTRSRTSQSIKGHTHTVWLTKNLRG